MAQTLEDASHGKSTETHEDETKLPLKLVWQPAVATVTSPERNQVLTTTKTTTTTTTTDNGRAVNTLEATDKSPTTPTKSSPTVRSVTPQDHVQSKRRLASANGETWMAMFWLLVQYARDVDGGKVKHIPPKTVYKQKPLGKWVEAQKSRYCRELKRRISPDDEGEPILSRDEESWLRAIDFLEEVDDGFRDKIRQNRHEWNRDYAVVSKLVPPASKGIIRPAHFFEILCQEDEPSLKEWYRLAMLRTTNREVYEAKVKKEKSEQTWKPWRGVHPFQKSVMLSKTQIRQLQLIGFAPSMGLNVDDWDDISELDEDEDEEQDKFQSQPDTDEDTEIEEEHDDDDDVDFDEEEDKIDAASHDSGRVSPMDTAKARVKQLPVMKLTPPVPSRKDSGNSGSASPPVKKRRLPITGGTAKASPKSPTPRKKAKTETTPEKVKTETTTTSVTTRGGRKMRRYAVKNGNGNVQYTLTPVAEDDAGTEESPDPTDGTVKLRNTDVLMGRGTHIALFKGNIFFRYVVWRYKAFYSVARKTFKTDIAQMVMNHILLDLNPPGRFVEEKDPGGPGKPEYVLVPRDRAFNKITQTLRELKNGVPQRGLEISQEYRTKYMTPEVAAKMDAIFDVLTSGQSFNEQFRQLRVLNARRERMKEKKV